MLYYEDNSLTEEEKEARDNMIYMFNPCLKALIGRANPEVFRQWGYNCCRQTAIMGAVIITPYLPKYTIEAYEINYDDVIDGIKTNYEHCVIIATKGSRRLLIDLARTSKPLVFCVIPEKTFDYPAYPAYRFVKRNWIKKIDWMSWATRGVYEYITHASPEQIYAALCRDMSMLASRADDEIIKYAEEVYAVYTQIEKSA